MKSAKKRAAFLKKRAARFAHHTPPAAVARFHRRPTIAHRVKLTEEVTLRAIYAITGD